MVQDFVNLYGETKAVFNVHSWVHKCEDARIHGSLDSFSAFSFESHMQTIGHCVTSRNMVAEQIFRRTMERSTEAIMHADIQFWDETLPSSATKRGLHGKTFRLHNTVNASEPPNNCVLIDNQPAIMVDISDHTVKYRYFKRNGNFFASPISSVNHNIYLCEQPSEEIRSCNCNDIRCKGLLIPYREHLVFYPIVHIWRS
ncbi:hypothetical protein FGIG_08092 [Fasciola gigantica]|uniref:Post-SET domain-containing protein n=1 Tax=Fasciola gigantica TaxID=46835 RepID=A0A504YJ48_FASGI|nr:hypothetical protein FGIG_08092 [Fasciola gigantica]